jgi:hypothetical protein
MHKFPINEYKTFSELPLDKFQTFKFSVYILDFNWNYLFVNDFAKANLGEKMSHILGKNMWNEFKELAADPVFNQIRDKMDRRLSCSYETTSPLNGQRIYITGYPLEDCFYFTSSILPDRQELLNDIRNQLTKKK